MRSAEATAVPEPLHWSSVLMRAVGESETEQRAGTTWYHTRTPFFFLPLFSSAECCSVDFMNFESSDSAELGVVVRQDARLRD